MQTRQIKMKIIYIISFYLKKYSTFHIFSIQLDGFTRKNIFMFIIENFALVIIIKKKKNFLLIFYLFEYKLLVYKVNDAIV